ncbi:MAG: undecaprenyl-diphosphatase UppP [Patescibacteria group bacterium]
MGLFEAVALGVVQGITEFLPISSTGHLILAREVFGTSDAHALAFDALLHLATAAAVILYFFKDIWLLGQTALRKLGRLPVNQRDVTLLYALAAGTVPAVILGLLLESTMETVFRDPLLVAGVLVAGSLFFIYAEWYYHNNVQNNVTTPLKGLKIGFFQALALIPGMSRSGATIAGGMILGYSRVEAARFAFLLAVPVILGAGAKKLIELIQSPDAVPWMAVLVGAVASFITGLAAIHFMLGFVRRNTLWPFIWYRIILAGFVVFVVMFG